MLCEKCKKRDANIQLIEIVNGVRTVHYYCTQCAQEMNADGAGFPTEGGFPLAQLLSSILAQTAMGQDNQEYAQIVCPTCGTTYEEFIQKSRFGCQDCYKVFGPLIDENIKGLQGSDVHKGKRPKYASDILPEQVREDLTDPGMMQGKDTIVEGSNLERLYQLKKELKEAIRQEEYEEAARLRDEIHKQEGEQNNDKMV